jgi:hypothetical protein
VAPVGGHDCAVASATASALFIDHAAFAYSVIGNFITPEFYGFTVEPATLPDRRINYAQNNDPAAGNF